MTRERSTQLRARWLLTDGSLHVVWWISNRALSLDELVDDAAADLADLLVDEHLQAVGFQTWHRVDDEHAVLVLDVPVRAWADPRRDLSRRSTTPEGIS